MAKHKVEQPPCLICGRERQHMRGCTAIGNENRQTYTLEAKTPDAPNTAVIPDRKRSRDPRLGIFTSEIMDSWEAEG